MNAGAGSVQGAAPLTICLDYRQELGGLTRGIRDLADAVGGRVISLDTGRAIEPADGPPAPHAGLVRIGVWSWGIRSPLGRLPARVERRLDAEIAKAPLVILHSLYRAHLPAVVRLCRRHRVPYWIVTHGMLDPWVMARRRLAKSLWMTAHGRPCLAGAAAVVFSTAAERDKAKPAYHGGNSVVIPWPVDLPDLSGRAEARAMLRTTLGVDESCRVLLWMGRYDTLKRPLEVVEAFAAGASQGWVLVMAGLPGDLSRERVAAAARRAAGRIHVREAAQGDEKAALLLGADAFISLSWRENFGYAMAEGMAFGLPVLLAPDHDLLAGGAAARFGYVCSDHSATAAAAAVRRLCTASASETAGAGARAREWVASNLARKRFSDELAALVNEHRPERAEARRLPHAASPGSRQIA